jgi:hypothetical protein
MSNFYAQIDHNNTVIGVSELHSQEIAEHLIPIDSYDISLLGKVYDNITNTFSDRAKTLDEVKADKKSELLQYYYGSFATFQSSATGTLKTYPIDLEAQDNLKDYQQRLIADSTKDSFWFKTIEDGTLIQHTRAQFLQLLEDAETFKVTQTIHYNDKLDEVNAATDEATVNTIVW